jgi:hypothetical protein
MAAGVTITDAALLERLALSDEQFLEAFLAIAANIPAREWTPAESARGLRYPWHRPEGSYLLRDGATLPADEDAVVRHLGAGRAPLLAFGSNVAPKNLAIKLAHHEEAEDREVLVLAGELHDLDVVAAASVTLYGAMPATLTASPGTRVRAAVLLVTATQLTTLTWGEIPYRLGRLDGAAFVTDEAVELDDPFAYVSRWGAFAPDGDPAPLAAVPATGRAWREWTQGELLERAAAIVGEESGEALVRAMYADAGRTQARVLPGLRPHSQPFVFDGWHPLV